MWGVCSRHLHDCGVWGVRCACEDTCTAGVWGAGCHVACAVVACHAWSDAAYSGPHTCRRLTLRPYSHLALRAPRTFRRPRPGRARRCPLSFPPAAPTSRPQRTRPSRQSRCAWRLACAALARPSAGTPCQRWHALPALHKHCKRRQRDATAPPRAPFTPPPLQVYDQVQALLGQPGYDIMVDTGDAMWRAHTLKLAAGNSFENQVCAWG